MPIHYTRLGSNLVEIRKARGLTQKQVSERLGISTEHLSHLENGNKNVQLKTLDLFCETMGVSYEQVLRGAVDVKITNSDEGNPFARKDAAETFSEITANCSDWFVKKLLDICRDIVEMQSKRCH